MRNSNFTKSLILRAINPADIKAERLAEMLVETAQDDEYVARVACYLLGEELPTFPQHSKIAGDESIGTFVSYDVFADHVNYTAKQTRHRWFTTPEEAEKFSQTGGGTGDYRCGHSDTYPYEGVHTGAKPYSLSCSSESWIRHAVD